MTGKGSSQMQDLLPLVTDLMLRHAKDLAEGGISRKEYDWAAAYYSDTLGDTPASCWLFPAPPFIQSPRPSLGSLASMAGFCFLKVLNTFKQQHRKLF